MIIFWFLTAFLLLCAFAFFVPWIRSWRIAVFWCLLAFVSSYGLYSHLGAARYLPEYYSVENKQLREARVKLRVELAEFRKKEFQLRLQLEQNPTDQNTQGKLLDLLAIQAMYAGEFERAAEYWQQALLQLSAKVDKDRIRYSLQTLRRVMEKVNNR